MTPIQKRVVLVSFLGWMLDAFDFFLLVFILKSIATDFHVSISDVTVAIMLTLMMRPVGAFLFGRLADRFGRKPLMIVNIIAYSVLEFASGFSPNLTIFFIVRALFGVAMGGEWGISSALTMESIPAKYRGLVSGILQAGYPCGYLLASLAFGLFFDAIGWRGMLMLGIIPALLVIYIRKTIPESPTWLAAKTAPKKGIVKILKQEWKLTLYAVLLMTAFNFLSHGTQDIYPTFLEVQRKFSVDIVSAIAIIFNVGAILGGIYFGQLSERMGRKRAILIAAILVLPLLPLWVLPHNPILLALGAFLIQFMVQGAWGVVPAYLNELSPIEIRATFPGFVYQLGNLFAAGNATIQTYLAQQNGGNYSGVMAAMMALIALALVLIVSLGRERKGGSLAVI